MSLPAGPWSPLVRRATLAFALTALGCNGAPSSAAATSSTSAETASPGAALLAKLTADNPDIQAAAKAIVATGDEGTRRAAGPRLVAAWKEISSPAWLAAKKEALKQEAAARGSNPERFDAEVDRKQKEALVEVGLSMVAIGGPDVIAFGFELGEDEGALLDMRGAGLSILEQVIPPGDAQAVARRAALAARLDALKAAAATSASAAPDSGAPDGGAARLANVEIGSVKASGGTIPNSAAVIAGMAAGFRRCANRALKDAPDSVKDGAAVVITATVGQTGEVLSAKTSGAAGLPQTVIQCMSARVESAQFQPPAVGTATLAIPIAVRVPP